MATSIPNKLSLSIGLNTKPLGNDLLKVNNQLKGFEGGLKGLSNDMRGTFTKPRGAIQGTTMAVVNFNRVIQDAPFGLMGVSNNIEPLLASFNNLKKQTGGAGAAIKTMLGAAFTGPGALITVASLATTGLLLFNKGMKKTQEESNKLKEDMSALLSEMDKVISRSTSVMFAGDDNELAQLDAEIRAKEEILQREKDIDDLRFKMQGNNYKEDEVRNERIKQLQEDILKQTARRQNLENLLANPIIAQLEAKREQLRIEQDLAKLTGVDERRANSNALDRQSITALTDLGENNPIVKLPALVPEATQTLREFTQFQIAQAQAMGQGFDRVADSFARTFVDGITDLKNFGDAWSAFGKSVVSALKEIAAQLLKMALIKGIGSILFPGSSGIFTGFDLASRIIGGAGGGASKQALNANLYIDGQNVRTTYEIANRRYNRVAGN